MQNRCVASRTPDTWFYEPGDGFKYTVVQPEKIQAVKEKETKEQRAAYILENYDQKKTVMPRTKISILRSDGLKFSIASPEKIAVYEGKSSAQEKREYVLENYDEKE